MRALRSFRSAVDGTAPGDSRLTAYLYWFSVSLIRLDRMELAARSLASAQKLSRRGFSRKMYARIVNGYGMARTGCVEHDDFRAFTSIQVGKYLGSRNKREFSSSAEREAIVRVLVGGWRSLSESGALEGLSCADRIEAFQSYHVRFPDVVLPMESSVIRADFRLGRRVTADDRCPCGSGLPYRMCCGRTITPFEAFHG